MSAHLSERVSLLPTDPGVYLFKNAAGKVIYVGKAKNLRARVRQYFSGQDDRPQVGFLVRNARDIEVVVVQTEKDALILENTLIKKHRPRYNIKLVDDASFLHLQIDREAPWPRYLLVRHIAPNQRGSRYRHFGPFASASRARATLEFLNRRFPLRTCSDRELKSRRRPCLLHQMGRCLAPCVDLCDADTYRRAVDASVLFLEGRNTELLTRLRTQMSASAQAENFEDAARLRDLIRAIEASIERQHVVDRRLGSRDLWGVHRVAERGVVALLPVRAGQMQEAITRHFSGAWATDAALLSSVLSDWYGAGAEIPPEVLLPWEPDDGDALSQLLSERRGAIVRLHVPQRGDKLRWMELTTNNARAAFERREAEADRVERTLADLQRLAHLPAIPRRIECFDNSNIQGTDPVASMVVFIDGRPDRARYRRFKVKTVVGSDDYATMREILGRRLRRGMAEGDLPDLIVVDGGKGQLNAALAVMAELGVRDQRQPTGSGPLVSVLGLAKPRTERAHGDRHATDKIVLPGITNPIRPSEGSPPLILLQALRDESHDTAVRYHRKVRRRSRLTSEIDALPGVGPARRKALLRHFGSVRAIRQATATELAQVAGIGPALAQRIAAALAQPE